MVTISVCMIVKNESKILSRCLDSLNGLYEELIIVDTGSSDNTKEIAARYTDKIYDFTWTGNFSDARNFAFSKATMEYIYSADADETLDSDNHSRFAILKAAMIPEVEIVQMKYGNQLANGSVYNFDEEYRPKLFKRLRTFTWIDPVHETVRTDPVVFDSDIIITHKQEELHADRDLAIFNREIEEGRGLSPRLVDMYARELYIAGTNEDFIKAQAFFEEIANTEDVMDELRLDACAVLAKLHSMQGKDMLSCTYVQMAEQWGSCSEICTMVGAYLHGIGEEDASTRWYIRAVLECEPVLDIRSQTENPKYDIDRESQ